MRKKIVIYSILISMIVFVITPFFLIFLADPCHIFHKPLQYFSSHGFNPLTRCQFAGLINSYLSKKEDGFDSVIIGSSISENFKPDYISKKKIFNRTMKLTLPGTDSLEQNILAKRSIEAGNIKQIYWEILPYMYRVEDRYNYQNIHTMERFPAYLYNNGRLDDYRYIFNMSTLSAAIDIWAGNTDYYFDSIDRIGYWENTCSTTGICTQFFRAEDVIEIQKSYIPAQRSFKRPEELPPKDYSRFDLYVFNVIQEHCNKQLRFDLFFPPVSLLWLSKLDERDFEYEMYMLRHVVQKVSACKNVRVFSFMNELWITADLSNYHDPRHFYGDIHDFMIDAMAENRDRITLDNIDAFEKEMIKNINEYQPYSTKMYPH